MARYVSGECLLLQLEDQEVLFCEIVSIQAHGYYYVTLTDGTYYHSSSRYPNMTVVHETFIEEATVHLE